MVTNWRRCIIICLRDILGFENIIVADKTTLKHRNLAMNLKASLKALNLDTLSIITAGDKYFFCHVETGKRQTGAVANTLSV